MGITNDVFPSELAFGIHPDQLKACDVSPDPEDKPDPVTGLRDIDHFAAFMKLLAPIARGPIDDTVRDGERVFAAIGCAACHVPALTTGPSANPLFDRKTVPLYSDLLLHDIGTGDGIRQADSTASPDEIRTPALWGLRLRGRSCTTAARQRSKTRSRGTRAKRRLRGRASSASTTARGRRCSRSSSPSEAATRRQPESGLDICTRYRRLCSYPQPSR